MAGLVELAGYPQGGTMVLHYFPPNDEQSNIALSLSALRAGPRDLDQASYNIRQSGVPYYTYR
jgi:hypothetical protein